MTQELSALTLAALLQVCQVLTFAIPRNIELSADYSASPRDLPPPRPLSKVTARLQRALNNHFEGLILFTIAVVVVTLSKQSTTLTATCGWLYLAARLAYIPAYAFGFSPWRSIIWSVGFLATIVMLLAALL